MSIGALHDPQTRSAPEPILKQGRLVRVVVPLAVMYNRVLAIINAHVMPLGFAHVALVEIMLLFVSLLLTCSPYCPHL
jgi:hypothetical protein